ncbi:MAG: membrane protein insertion efficiency factor YidD [Patescibacteria group bacterium]
MTKLALLLIRLYQRFISPLIGGQQACRFTPRCSQYSYQAIAKYGILKGTLLGMKRISKCHPFHPGGSDPLI